MKAKDVKSPIGRWRLVDVLCECEGRIEDWSMAVGWFDDRPVLVMRWDGKGELKGNPISRGYPTWFVLPDETYGRFIDSEFIPDTKREFVRGFLGLPLVEHNKAA